jgi:hypothetical protein
MAIDSFPVSAKVLIENTLFWIEVYYQFYSTTKRLFNVFVLTGERFIVQLLVIQFIIG